MKHFLLSVALFYSFNVSAQNVNAAFEKRQQAFVDSLRQMGEYSEIKAYTVASSFAKVYMVEIKMPERLIKPDSLNKIYNDVVCEWIIKDVLKERCKDYFSIVFIFRTSDNTPKHTYRKTITSLCGSLQ
jgi:hypothetical protein